MLLSRAAPGVTSMAVAINAPAISLILVIYFSSGCKRPKTLEPLQTRCEQIPGFRTHNWLAIIQRIVSLSQ
ncbi:hypothetical protein BSZ22_04630 [Bradyrhizobium canariense]|uniref:Uncharacterized protein n=1 Tax=Bradyrhizobium canariense TaxID=255045 RepID=A0A1X3GWU3_9BRAD|nr:hypothetical protein BSZ22_04630 [Bradyrhizobium canariense]OSI81907.1 hypothetical protein BSZ23_04335 [Bradyrhizobium canariense]OSJ01849.1 hypothetical protein BSZ18_39335 [Bradyrhizobium canariense]